MKLLTFSHPFQNCIINQVYFVFIANKWNMPFTSTLLFYKFSIIIRVATPTNVPSEMCAKAKIPTSLRIRAVWSESSLGDFWIAYDAKILHANKEDSDPTASICRLI